MIKTGVSPFFITSEHVKGISTHFSVTIIIFLTSSQLAPRAIENKILMTKDGVKLKFFDYKTQKIAGSVSLSYRELNKKSEGILQKLAKATKRRSEYGNKPLNPQQKIPSKVIRSRGGNFAKPQAMGSSKGKITYEEVIFEM